MALTEASPVDRIIETADFRCTITLKAGENCRAGDAIGFGSGWRRALATVGTVIACQLVALEDGIGGDVIEAAQLVVIGGFTGGTPGASVYSAEGSAAGEYTETEPSTQFDIKTILGYVLSTTQILVMPSTRASQAVP